MVDTLAAGVPAEVTAVLTEAGWTPGRRVVAATTQAIRLVTDLTGRDGAQLEPFGIAVRVLDEFGGLYVSQDGPGRDLRRRPFALDPTLAAATAETLVDFGRVLGARLFPLGVEGDQETVLALDEYGRVFALDHAGEWFLGETIGEALTTLVTGVQPERVRDDGSWPGRRPPPEPQQWPDQAPLARTPQEAYLYIERQACACGERRYELVVSDVVEAVGGLESVVTVRCAGCDAEREFRFALPAEPAVTSPGEVRFGGDEPSQLLGPQEWLAVADDAVVDVPEDFATLRPEQRGALRRPLATAVAAVGEVLKFVPAGGDAVPEAAFGSADGQAAYRADPGRFQVASLTALRDRYRRLLAAVDG